MPWFKIWRRYILCYNVYREFPAQVKENLIKKLACRDVEVVVFSTFRSSVFMCVVLNGTYYDARKCLRSTYQRNNSLLKTWSFCCAKTGLFTVQPGQALKHKHCNLKCNDDATRGTWHNTLTDSLAPLKPIQWWKEKNATEWATAWYKRLWFIMKLSFIWTFLNHRLVWLVRRQIASQACTPIGALSLCLEIIIII